jgi:hypothetical protein
VSDRLRRGTSRARAAKATTSTMALYKELAPRTARFTAFWNSVVEIHRANFQELPELAPRVADP